MKDETFKFIRGLLVMLVILSAYHFFGAGVALAFIAGMISDISCKCSNQNSK
jgi:hypothetical protein